MSEEMSTCKCGQPIEAGACYAKFAPDGSHHIHADEKKYTISAERIPAVDRRPERSFNDSWD